MDRGHASGQSQIVARSFSCHPLLMTMTKYEVRPRRVIFYEPSSDTYLPTPQQELFQVDAMAAFAPLFQIMNQVDDEELVQQFFASTGDSRAWQEIDDHARGVYVGAVPALRSAFDGITPTSIDATALLALHDSEVHVVRGSDTREMFKVACEGLPQAIPGCRSHLIEGADHLLPARRPARFFLFVKEVLKGKSGTFQLYSEYDEFPCRDGATARCPVRRWFQCFRRIKPYSAKRRPDLAKSARVFLPLLIPPLQITGCSVFRTGVALDCHSGGF